MNARALHDDAVVVDAHNDLPVLLLMRNQTLGPQGVERYWSEVWVPEAHAGGLDVQVLPIYVAPSAAEYRCRRTSSSRSFGWRETWYRSTRDPPIPSAMAATR